MIQTLELKGGNFDGKMDFCEQIIEQAKSTLDERRTYTNMLNWFTIEKILLKRSYPNPENSQVPANLCFQKDGPPPPLAN